jgi:hypothetical protein
LKTDADEKAKTMANAPTVKPNRLGRTPTAISAALILDAEYRRLRKVSTNEI